MGGMEIRTFDAPDEELVGENGRAGVVTVHGLKVWKAVFEPGWRYTVHVDPEGNACTSPHAAYIASGRLGVRAHDGTEAEIGPGSFVFLEPGHDAWTVGDEPCVFIDFVENLQGESGG